MRKARIKNDGKIGVGQNIRRLREKKQMKARELVTKLQLEGIDITGWSLSKIEAGKQHVTASQFKAMAEILEVDCMELLKEAED